MVDLNTLTENCLWMHVDRFTPKSDENEISLYVITNLFKHSSDEKRESDHQGLNMS